MENAERSLLLGLLRGFGLGTGAVRRERRSASGLLALDQPRAFAGQTHASATLARNRAQTCGPLFSAMADAAALAITAAMGEQTGPQDQEMLTSGAEKI